MGPRRPEVEYISKGNLESRKQRGADDTAKEAYKCLQKLANNALKCGPFSITFEKTSPHVAPTGDIRDFLSYAPYWWPENPKDPDTRFVRLDGKRNPDIGNVKDQVQLESLAENITYLCLAFYFFNNDNYAIHAVSLLSTFFVDEKMRMNPNLNYAQFVRGSQNKTRLGRGEGVISSRVLSRIANVLPILDAHHSYHALKPYIWSWFDAYYNWLLNNPIALEAAHAKNNIHTWYIVQVASIEHFLHPNSPQASNRILSFFQKSLPKQLDLKTGDQPLESKRAKPFHYLAFNMQAIIFLAELAKDSGLDIYNSSNLIHLATRYIAAVKVGDKDDITEAIRCFEIFLSRIPDQDDRCRRFIDKAYHCKYADKIGGPKNAIHVLWS